MTTASTRGRANVARGKEAERQVARYLTAALGTKVIRYVRAGHSAAHDPGDLTADGLIIDVKDDLEVYRIPRWLAALDAMDGPEEAVRFLVIKWRQHPVAAWHVWTRAGILVPLTTGHEGESGRYLTGEWARRVKRAEPYDRLRVPVRLALTDFATMLAETGFYEGSDDHGSSRGDPRAGAEASPADGADPVAADAR